MKSIRILLPAACLLSVAACGGDAPPETATVDVSGKTPQVTFKPDEMSHKTVKPFQPVQIAHRLVGKPVVGQPITVDLKLTTADGSRPIDVSFRIPDGTALDIPQDQPRDVSLAIGDDGRTAGHQITVIPMREGRIYLNVSAAVDTPEGIMSYVTAIPLQVGDAPRELVENGTVVETESGELIRSLPAKQ